MLSEKAGAVMRLWVIRHGESENNRDRIWTGQSDTPLTEKGRSDAERVKPLLDGVKFDRVYSSDLKRAKSTADIVMPDADISLTPLLREMNVGDLTGSPISVLTAEERAEATRLGYGKYNGETRDQLKERILGFTKDIAESGSENVAAFSHAGWLRGFADEVIGIPLPRQNIICANCAVGIFEYDGKKWRLHSWINLI